MHSACHDLVSKLDQGFLGQSRIVSYSDEAVSGERLKLDSTATVYAVIVIENRCIQVCLIIVTITGRNTEDGVLAWGPLQVATVPGVFLAVRFTDALHPCIERLVVEFDAVIGRRLKLVAVEVLDDAFLPASADRLLSCLTASEDLNMDHVMLLLFHLRVVVDASIEDKVTGLHLFKLQVDRQSVKLVTLVPSV